MSMMIEPIVFPFDKDQTINYGRIQMINIDIRVVKIYSEIVSVHSIKNLLYSIESHNI